MLRLTKRFFIFFLSFFYANFPVGRKLTKSSNDVYKVRSFIFARALDAGETVLNKALCTLLIRPLVCVSWLSDVIDAHRAARHSLSPFCSLFYSENLNSIKRVLMACFIFFLPLSHVTHVIVF